MAKSKWPQVKEQLQFVEGWAKLGLTEEQIAHNLGIGRSTLGEFKNKYPELQSALKKGRTVAVAELENTLYKRALGYDYEISRTSLRMIDGKEAKFVQKIRKHMPADVGAIIILLKNKDRGNWCDNPAKQVLDREIFEFRKRMELARLYGDEMK
ncbi:transposase [Desulfosporosinus sp. FKA]|uniref:transposase n=1 Tax=Desulfosporosinus sp. FKA TaxID=1969834 RepID=UPI000B497542|nr:transposase [Desulfosporosinus sp. FKA]